MTLRPRIRTILLVVNLFILMLPVAGVAGLRIYDNELLRQTEAALLAQGAVLASTYRHQVEMRLRYDEIDPADYGLPAEVSFPEKFDEELGPFPPRLDVTSTRVRPAAPPAIPAAPPDSFARGAGAAMTPIIDGTQEIAPATVAVMDWRATVVSSTGHDGFRSVANREEVKRALLGEVVTMLRERDSAEPVSWFESLSRRRRVLVFVATPVVWEEEGPQGVRRVFGAVVLSKPPLELSQALYESRDLFAGLVGTLLLGVTMLTMLTTITIQRPIRQLMRQARRIAATGGGGTRRIDKPGTREFEELSEAIANMARTLDERNEYIRTFARDVSHEFKTPLASIKGTVELLEDHFETMPSERREKFLRIIADDTERLDRLVRRLLELARADVFRPTTDWVDAVELLPELADRSKVELRLDLGEAKSLPVAMARDVVESVFTNLFDNAAQHGSADVKVELIDDRGSDIRLLVSDDGPGISLANREKIFQSFFTTARDEGGTGLGLPIVRSLLLRHGGDIQLTPAEERGASFLVTMPRAGRPVDGQ